MSSSHAISPYRARHGGAHEVDRLTTSIESLIGQLAEQIRELKRKRYEVKVHNEHFASMTFTDTLIGLPDRAIFDPADSG